MFLVGTAVLVQAARFWCDVALRLLRLAARHAPKVEAMVDSAKKA